MTNTSFGFPGTRHSCAVLLLFLIITPVASACDFCNCLMGINPYYNGLDRIGVNVLFQNSWMDAVHPNRANPSGGAQPALLGYRPSVRLMHTGDTVPTTERRTTFELSVQHHFSERWLVTLLIPYSVGVIQADERTGIAGFGDPAVLAQYVAGDTIFGAPAYLVVGGGVKLPLGKRSLTDAGGMLLDPALQPGSGSFDWVAQVTATASFAGWTVGVNAGGRLNTANSDGFRFGNSLSASATLSRDLYRHNPAQFAIVGIAGVRLEAAGKNMDGSSADDDSGFTTTFASLGGQIVWDSFKLDATVLVPVVSQHSAGAPVERPRVLTGLRYEF